MAEDQVLELENRRRVYEVTQTYPGLHMRALQRKLGMSIGLIEYHLNALEKHGLVTSVSEGGYKRFFPSTTAAGAGSPQDGRERRLLGVLRQRIPLKVALILLETSRATLKEISDRLVLSPSLASYHLKKLLAAEIVTNQPVGDSRGYSLFDANRVAQLLVANAPPPDLLEEFAEMWEGFASRQGPQRPPAVPRPPREEDSKNVQ